MLAQPRLSIYHIVHIVKLKNMTIPPQSTEIHGITNEIMNEKGVDLLGVIAKFYDDLHRADICVAHNLKFDKSMIMVESARLNISSELFENKINFIRSKVWSNIEKNMLQEKH